MVSQPPAPGPPEEGPLESEDIRHRVLSRQYRPTMVQSLARLIEEITVDAYDTDEQMSGFLQVFQDEVALPVAATVLGVAVEVTGFDLGGDERRGLVARCRHQETDDVLSLADVHFGPNTVAGWLHAAYRTWLCLPPFPAGRPSGWAWPEP